MEYDVGFLKREIIQLPITLIFRLDGLIAAKSRILCEAKSPDLWGKQDG